MSWHQISLLWTPSLPPAPVAPLRGQTNTHSHIQTHTVIAETFPSDGLSVGALSGGIESQILLSGWIMLYRESERDTNSREGETLGEGGGGV